MGFRKVPVELIAQHSPIYVMITYARTKIVEQNTSS
jgi:hypothetical protein